MYMYYATQRSLDGYIMTGIHEWHLLRSVRPACQGIQVRTPRTSTAGKRHSQEGIMAPDTTKLVVAYHLVPRYPERVRNFPLLLNGEQDITLDSEHENWGVG